MCITNDFVHILFLQLVTDIKQRNMRCRYVGFAQKWVSHQFDDLPLFMLVQMTAS